MDTKVCSKCHQTLPKINFIHNQCRPCINEKQRERYAVRKLDSIWRTKRNARSRESKRRNPRSYEQRKREWLKSLYKITPEHYDNMLLSQNGVCAICKQKCTTTKGLAVDHDHKCCPGNKSCGQCIRGLLCSNCNKGIGIFREDIVIFNNAIEYLSAYTVQKIAH